MEKFENVTVLKRANIYYDGKVTSTTVEFPDGSVKSLGVMLPGEYTFNTADAEVMEMMSGEFSYRLPEGEWLTPQTPHTFEVPANSSFDIKVESVTNYCCSYIS